MKSSGSYSTKIRFNIIRFLLGQPIRTKLKNIIANIKYKAEGFDGVSIKGLKILSHLIEKYIIDSFN